MPICVQWTRNVWRRRRVHMLEELAGLRLRGAYVGASKNESLALVIGQGVWGSPAAFLIARERLPPPPILFALKLEGTEWLPRIPRCLLGPRAAPPSLRNLIYPLAVGWLPFLALVLATRAGTCEFGIAWANDYSADPHYYAECSNKGLCDRETGECVCFDGYTGAACKRSKSL